MEKDNKAEPPKSNATELDETELENVNGGFFGSLVKRAGRVNSKVGTPPLTGKK